MPIATSWHRVHISSNPVWRQLLQNAKKGDQEAYEKMRSIAETRERLRLEHELANVASVCQN